MDEPRKKQMLYSSAYLLIALLIAWLFQSLIFRPLVARWSEISYSRFVEQPGTGIIGTAQLTEERILYELKQEEDSS